MVEPVHPVLDAVRPLVDRIGAVVVGPTEIRADDVPLSWDGVIVAGIRLPTPTSVDGPEEHSVRGDVSRQSDDPFPSRSVQDVAESPAADNDAPGGLDGIIVELERSLGTPLAELSRTGKQQAVRLLEESGAFSYRKSVEVVASALGVSRFTVYNYLNRDRD